MPLGREISIDTSIPSHSSTKPSFDRIDQVELRPQLTQPLPPRAVEEAVVGTGGQSGEIELDAEMKRLARNKPFEQIGNRQAAAAGLERDGFGNSHRQIAGGSLRSQLQLHAVGIAAQAGFVLPGQEIATLGRLATGQRRERNLRIVKVIDQALARIGVVLQT